jgi:hypothetical protein
MFRVGLFPLVVNVNPKSFGLIEKIPVENHSKASGPHLIVAEVVARFLF